MSADLHPPLDPDELAALAVALRAALLALPPQTATLTYQELARALGLRPPNTIYRVVQALELSMREDAAAGRPFIAARVISRVRGGLPAPGFFDLATRLGRHDGSEHGESARGFHQGQLDALAELATR
ncbi:MAG TPA: hypothetical protein VN259_16225 [Xanthomonadales bacterium]|nr:hypothetical protein [Xanthomonadales bacterium]